MDTWVSLFVASIEKLAPLSFFFFYLLSSDDAYIIKWRSEKQLGYHLFLPLDISSTISFIHLLLTGETDLWCCHLLFPTLHWWCFFPEFSIQTLYATVSEAIYRQPWCSSFHAKAFLRNLLKRSCFGIVENNIIFNNLFMLTTKVTKHKCLSIRCSFCSSWEGLCLWIKWIISFNIDSLVMGGNIIYSKCLRAISTGYYALQTQRRYLGSQD